MAHGDKQKCRDEEIGSLAARLFYNLTGNRDKRKLRPSFNFSDAE
jgi:hypothetical protein